MTRTLLSRRPLSLLGALLATSAPALAQSIRHVNADGSGDFVDVQAAVDAAGNGDVLLVGPGNYSGFTVDGKVLWISADLGARPRVDGQVELRGLPAGQRLVLIGFDVFATPSNGVDVAAPALYVHDNPGHLRIQDCSFRGANGTLGQQAGNGGLGARIEGNLSLSLDACAFRGGDGGLLDNDLAEVGGSGGAGARFAGSLAAAYDSTFEGGMGRSVTIAGPAGEGGDGAFVATFGLYASASTFSGGRGGNNDDFIGFPVAGDGGDGLYVMLGAQAQMLEVTSTGGAGGSSFFGPDGTPGQGLGGGGIQHTLPGQARLIGGASLAPDAGSVDLELRGVAGDQVWLASERGGNFQFALSKLGVWLVPRPVLLPVLPVGTIPASGVLELSVPAVDIGPSLLSAGWMMQAYVVTASGSVVLGGPHAILLANCEVLSPDCNGNGEWDTCDVLRATSPDCDADGVPDDCQADCNGNGIADACDIAGGEPDANGNGVPDSCEPLVATWHVDPSAPAGGNGSAGFPFQTIRQAAGVSLSGHEIVLHDGTYTGPDNRAIQFVGRGPVVRSLNGPAACIVDLQLQGRAFDFRTDPANTSARVEGITFRNGKDQTGDSFYAGAIEIQNASPAIVGCVFESCQGPSGGAIRVRNSKSLIRDCLFVGNQHTQAGFEGGGAIYASASGGSAPRILRCTFRDNTAAGTGGAIASAAGGPTLAIVIADCRFEHNTANVYGGALAGGGGHTRLEGCLLERNHSLNGGALAGPGTLYLLGCTVVGNTATIAGGAVNRDFNSAGFVRDTILYGNGAPSGPQILVRNNSSLTVEWSDVQGGLGATVTETGGTITWGAGNVDVDPLFVDPDGADDDPATGADNDWRLGFGSPCVDAGSNALVPTDSFDLDGDLDTLEAVPFDLLGQPRFRDDPAVADTGSGTPPLVDLGALERQP